MILGEWANRKHPATTAALVLWSGLLGSDLRAWPRSCTNYGQ